MRDVVAGISVYVKKAVNELVLEMLTASQKGVHSRLTAALEMDYQGSPFRAEGREFAGIHKHIFGHRH